MDKEPILRIYGCGGCGANLLQDKIVIPSSTEYPRVETVIVDTSDANYKRDAGIAFYRIPGTEGMGRKRGFALDVTEDKIDDILKKHKPGSMNVIICSAGGGSGSVIGLLLAKEFMSRGIPFVIQLVGSSASMVEAQNSHGTLLSLQKAVNDLRKPLPFMYYENMNNESKRIGDGPRDVVDEYICKDILTFSLAVSEKHSGLDRQDISNWLDYPNVTKIGPQLVEVKICRHDEMPDLEEDLFGKVISSITLLHNTEEQTPLLRQTYEKTGYMTDDSASLHKPFTMVVSSDNVSEFAGCLKEEVKEFKRVGDELNSNGGLSLDDEEDEIL